MYDNPCRLYAIRAQLLHINIILKVFCVSGNRASDIDTYIEFIMFYVANELNMIFYNPHRSPVNVSVGLMSEFKTFH